MTCCSQVQFFQEIHKEDLFLIFPTNIYRKKGYCMPSGLEFEAGAMRSCPLTAVLCGASTRRAAAFGCVCLGSDMTQRRSWAALSD